MKLTKNIWATSAVRVVNSKFFFCSGSLKFITIEKACNGRVDCAGGEDENVCVSKLRINNTFPGDYLKELVCSKELTISFSKLTISFSLKDRTIVLKRTL